MRDALKEPPGIGGHMAQLEQIFKTLFGDTMTEKPACKMSPLKRTSFAAAEENKNNLGWTFISTDLKKITPTRTYFTLDKLASQNIYFTPNSFFSRKYRKKEALRWITAIVIDVDDKNIPEDKKRTAQDIFDRCSELGLPAPTLINKTPNGLHVYWFIHRARALPKVVILYEALQTALVQAFNADFKAIGAERYFRVPNAVWHFDENLVYSLEDFRTWRDIWANEHMQELSYANMHDEGAIFFYPGGVLVQPAICVLLQGVEEGKRNTAAFTLALAHKADKVSQYQTEAILQQWNKNNNRPLPESVITKHVRSAYKKKYRGPKPSVVRTLTGMYFSPQKISEYKSRHIRGKYKKINDLKRSIQEYLESKGGQVSMSQQKLAEAISAPLRSVKKSLLELREEGKIEYTTEGVGRSSRTTYTLLSPEEPAETRVEKSGDFVVVSASDEIWEMSIVNGAKSYIPMVRRVGGRCLVFEKQRRAPRFTPHKIVSESINHVSQASNYSWRGRVGRFDRGPPI